MPGYNIPPRRTLKDYFLPFTILLAVGALVVLGFRLWGMSSTDETATTDLTSLTATVTAAPNAAEVYLPASGAWKILESSATLGAGERVRTAVTGTAELNLPGGTQVVLAGNTELTVTTLESGLLNKKADLTLEHGRVWLDATAATREVATIKTAILNVSAPASAAQLSFDPAKNNEVELSVVSGAAAATVWDAQENQKMTTLPVEQGQTLTLTDRRINLLRIGGEIELVKETPAPILAEAFYAAQAAKTGIKTVATGTTMPAATDSATAPSALPATEAAIPDDITTAVVPAETADPTIATGTLAAPGITAPVGGTLTTIADTVKIAGTVAATTAKVEVTHNGGTPYVLNNYKAGSTAWSYNAAVKHGNLLAGENRYTVVAIDAAGSRSQPTVVTITYATAATTTSETAPTITSTTTTTPAASITITAPTSSASTTTTTFGKPTVSSPAAGATVTTAPVRLAGSVPAGTTAVEVNGYKLGKGFTAGGTSWYYNAAPDYDNIVVGANAFTITAIGPNGEQSSTSVTFTYQPAAASPAIGE